MLLELDDEALDGALLLTARQSDGSRVPTLTGLLLIGRETSLRQLVPTHEFVFQVLAQQAVRFNEFRRFPLLKALDWLETNFRPYNPEEELQVGLFRVPVPKVDLGAFREAVAALRETKRVTADELAVQIQRDSASAKRTLEALTEAGLVEAHGSTRGRSYTLSASLYQAVGDKAGYTRQAGFTPIQHEQMVLNYVQQHGQIQRAEVMDLCRLSPDQAAKLLKRMKDKGALIQQGERRWSIYKLG